MNSPPRLAAADTTANRGPRAQKRADTRLRGGPLLLARAAWAAVVLLALGLFGAGIPYRIEDLHQQYQGAIPLDMRRNHAGQIVVSPWRGEAAAQAGILEGDILVAIDGAPPDIGPGEPSNSVQPAAGEMVTLEVRTGDRPARRYTIPRGTANGRMLAQLGLAERFIVAYDVAVDAVLVVLVALIVALIFWHRSNDWMALLVSGTLMTTFIGLSETVIALSQHQPAWEPTLAIWFFAALGCLSLYLYLFPSGRFVPRWTAGLIAIQGGWMLAAQAYPQLYPWRMPPLGYFLAILGWLGAGLFAQAYRYRRVSGAVERQQTKWVVLGAVAAALGLLGRVGLAQQPAAIFDLVVYPAGRLFELLLPLAIGIAILRYRLFDIDLIIRRTLVYGALTASVVAAYVVIVGTLSVLFQAQGSPLIALVATGLVAMLFQPLRDRLQRGVNHLLYGERDDPYRVLTRLADRLEAVAASEAVLPALVETVAQALKLPYAAIALRRRQDDGASGVSELDMAGGGEFELVAWYGTPPAAIADELPLSAAPDRLVSVPLLYQSEPIGRLLLAPRAAEESLSPADERLLRQIAGQAGAVAHAVRLTTDLQRARERLVGAREEERRRLRRDLHDGLGPVLASQGLKLAAARQLLSDNPAQAEHLLDQVLSQNAATVAEIRRLVYALRPPALDELGLVAAIRDQVSGMSTDSSASPGPRISVEGPAAGLPALPAAIEVAAYRIALEALTNTIRHARAHTCVLQLALDETPAGSCLQVVIQDDGQGLAPNWRAGVGLRSMRERAEEVGGTCIVEARPAGGTRVCVRLPLNGAA